MQAALQELEFQMTGMTAEEEAKALGKAINAEYVLFAEARSLGDINIFIAQILHVEDGSQLTGDSRNYRAVDDGMRLMPELALLLTDRAASLALIDANERGARFNSIGISAGTSFAEPWIIGTIRGTFAPFKTQPFHHTFFQVGIDAGFINMIENVEYYSLYPYIRYALFLPISDKTAWHIGLGFGCMISSYSIDDLNEQETNFAFDIGTGFLLFNFLELSYSLRTDFTSASHKIAVGFVYRFK